MVTVVGAGLVGASLALGLAQAGHRVRLIDAQAPVKIGETLDLRVVALNPASIAWLQQTGIWDLLDQSRIGKFTSLAIEDQGQSLSFEAAEHGLNKLGVIVENNHLVSVAQAACQKHPLIESQFSTEFVYDKTAPDLIIAADGAQSALRQALRIPCFTHDYHQKAMVAYVRLEKPHRNQAWQIFLPTGPLAFLPMADPHIASIVWTQPQEDLTLASNHHYGSIEIISEIAYFPLRMQLADQYFKNQVVFVGDAIHAIHPLAGQGVNLGFADATVLLKMLLEQDPSRWSHPLLLKRYQRSRKPHNLMMAHAMSAFNFIFSRENPYFVSLRKQCLDKGFNFLTKDVLLDFISNQE